MTHLVQLNYHAVICFRKKQRMMKKTAFSECSWLDWKIVKLPLLGTKAATIWLQNDSCNGTAQPFQFKCASHLVFHYPQKSAQLHTVFVFSAAVSINFTWLFCWSSLNGSKLARILLHKTNSVLLLARQFGVQFSSHKHLNTRKYTLKPPLYCVQYESLFPFFVFAIFVMVANLFVQRLRNQEMFCTTLLTVYARVCVCVSEQKRHCLCWVT